MLRGREFTEADDANPAVGFVVNDAFAKAYLSDVDPLGVSLKVRMEKIVRTPSPLSSVVGKPTDVHA